MEDTSVLKDRVLKVIVPLVAVVAIAAAGYLYLQVRTLKKNPQVAAQKETADLIAKVSQSSYALPKDETPTVATVSDPESLKDQVFFAQAQKGDKVLIYAKSKKAILYSVTLNKIIEIAPLNIGGGKGVTPPASKATDTTPKTTQ